MTETSEQDSARAQIIGTLGLAGEVVETCVLAARVLAEHEPIGGGVMITSRNAGIIIDALGNGAVALRLALEEACEKFQHLPTRKE